MRNDGAWQSRISATIWCMEDGDVCHWIVGRASEIIVCGVSPVAEVGSVVINHLREYVALGEVVAVHAPLGVQIAMQLANDRGSFIDAHKAH